jgi:hypothetical protein
MKLKPSMTGAKSHVSRFLGRLTEFFATPTDKKLHPLTGLSQAQRQEIAASWATAYQGRSLQARVRQMRKIQEATLQQKRFAKVVSGEAQ